jgi:Gametolysin peptidase M11
MSRFLARVRWAVLPGLLLALLAPAPAAGVTGTQRVLVVMATWGPQPFSLEDVRRVVFQDADAFLRRSSHGQLRLEGDATPWARVLTEAAVCPAGWLMPDVPLAVADPALAAAQAAGFRIADYDRFVYLVPRTSCAFDGLGWNSEVLLNGVLDSRLVVHELGHSWGLAHAAAAWCALYCTLDAVGDPYSVMGDGLDDFSVFEKLALGWHVPVATATPTRRLSIARADRAGRAAKALRVPVAAGEYWLEYRPQPRGRTGRFGPVAPGVLVRYVNPAEAQRPLGPPPVLLLPDGPEAGPALTSGETFRAPGIFSTRVVSMNAGWASLRFTWTDKRRPRGPEIIELSYAVNDGLQLAVRWDGARDEGSGISHYLVSVDGKPPVKVLRRSAELPTTGSRAHKVSVVAVDRAGNRSAPTVRHFEVRRG